MRNWCSPLIMQMLLKEMHGRPYNFQSRFKTFANLFYLVDKDAASHKSFEISISIFKLHNSLATTFIDN